MEVRDILLKAGLEPVGCSPEQIAEVLGSQPLCPPAEFIEFLEECGATPVPESNHWSGVFYPGIVTVRACAERRLEEYSRPLHLLDEVFVLALWHQSHPVSHRWWEDESWTAFYAFDQLGNARLEILDLGPVTYLGARPARLGDLVARLLHSRLSAGDGVLPFQAP